MGINNYLKTLFLLLLSLHSAFSQSLEEQRKYFIKNKAAFVNFIHSSAVIDGLSIYNHSQYTYFDIYLDTPDFDLYKNNLSFRFRKRFFGNGIITYGLQLKSEMETDSSARMEIEDKELEFYRVKTDSGWVALPVILDIFFVQIEKNTFDPDSKEIQQANTYLKKWIEFNAEGPIATFQKIQHLKLKGFENEKIKKISAVICGSEKRIRSHVYIDTANTTEELKKIPENTMEFSLKPEFFKNNTHFNWILETSLDSAIFFVIGENKLTKTDIVEFEVENKYFIPQTGRKIMNQFENGLKRKFQMERMMDSKYCQCIKKFSIDK